MYSRKLKLEKSYQIWYRFFKDIKLQILTLIRLFYGGQILNFADLKPVSKK